MKSQQNLIELGTRPDVFKRQVVNVHSMEWDALKMTSAVQRSAGRTGNVFQKRRVRYDQAYRSSTLSPDLSSLGIGIES